VKTISFHTTTNFTTSGSNPRMTINTNGYVGIGTTTPVTMLQVAGSARFDQGISYIPPMGDLSMGAYTNHP